MGDDDRREAQGGYVHQVRDETRRYLQELLAENERLRLRTAALESERGRWVSEKLALQEKMLALREELERVQGAHDDLHRRLADAEAESRRFAERFTAVEQQNNNLANLYVASYQLHSTLDRDEVIAAIQEIVINLIGCEELAIFELEPGAPALQLVGSFGVDRQRLAAVPLGAGRIGRAALAGETDMAAAAPWSAAPLDLDGHLTACVPLKMGEQVLGAVAMFRLLPQKSGGLEPVDRELLSLLATHAATALYVTRLHRTAAAGAAAVDAGTVR